jgi:hypothetical protein
MCEARRPWPTALAIVDGPVTASPAANTQGSDVCMVTESACRALPPAARSGNVATSTLMPIATTAMSQASSERSDSS